MSERQTPETSIEQSENNDKIDDPNIVILVVFVPALGLFCLEMFLLDKGFPHWMDPIFLVLGLGYIMCSLMIYHELIYGTGEDQDTLET